MLRQALPSEMLCQSQGPPRQWRTEWGHLWMCLWCMWCVVYRRHGEATRGKIWRTWKVCRETVLWVSPEPTSRKVMEQAVEHESNSHLKWQTDRQTAWQCSSQAGWQTYYLWTAWVSGELVVLQDFFLTGLILPLCMLGVPPRIIPQIMGFERKSVLHL